ncbi:MAG: nuclear transport factor 2 family protein [Phycisphaerales bacterium]|nr:nuclear transport factor 2 family protein [Phycisphaerales bacterium]
MNNQFFAALPLLSVMGFGIAAPASHAHASTNLSNLSLESISTLSRESEPVTEKAVINAIEEYVYGKYASDTEAVLSRTHHDLARRVVLENYMGLPSEEWIEIFSQDQLKFYGTPFNRTHSESPRDGRCEIEVFDIEQFTAAARVVMEDVVDYMHLVLFDGRWVIADSAVIVLDQPGADAPEITTTDQDTIEQIVRDYCIGFYEIDGKKVQDTCHTALSKRSVENPDEVDFNYFNFITWEEIELLGESFNKHWGFDPETARCEVEVYEIRDNVAIAKLTGSVWFDYFHIMRINGEWSIVNIMYESLPQERWSDVG